MPIRFMATTAIGTPRTLIFKGNVWKSKTTRQGPDIITTIEAVDGGFAVREGQVQVPLAANWKSSDAIAMLVNNYYVPLGVSLGAVGNIQDVENCRGRSFSGSVWDCLKTLVGPNGRLFINKEKVYALDENDYLELPAMRTTIDASAGLLDAPDHHENIVDFRMLFEPRFDVGQSVNVVSTILPENNGIYVIRGISHDGTISGAKDSGAFTTISAWKDVGGRKFQKVVPR
jgi:hypothetical protein